MRLLAASASDPPALAVHTFLVAGGYTVSYELAPITWKDWLTKMWWGQLTPM